MRRSIADLITDGSAETNEIRKILDQEDRILSYIAIVQDLKEKWDDVVYGNNNFESTNSNTNEDIQDDNKKDVSARTNWKVSGDSMKIETERYDGPPYSNVFALALFKEIALIALGFIERNGSVKTSEVVHLLSNKIISTSDYKKTPRIPVYATFKVLVKENKFKIDEHNSHKYLLGVSKEKLNNWIEHL